MMCVFGQFEGLDAVL